MHPVLRLLMTQPELLGEHAQAYAQLLSTEIAEVSVASKHKTLWSAAVLVCLGAVMVLAGVALMLWAVVPEISRAAAWTLLATPLLPGVAAFGCLLGLRSRCQAPAFDKLRQQIQADIQMLRDVGTP